MKRITKTIEAVDLFCGAGGLTNGLQQSGINVSLGVDVEVSCRYAFEKNNNSKFLCKDVKKVSKEDVIGSFQNQSSIKVLAGCAPCQPFSTYQNGKDTSLDKKWPLLYEFSRLIKEVEPDVITMENVPEVVKHKVYHDFAENLRQLGYYVWADTVNCLDYGLPQKRRRHVLLASKLGQISIIPPTCDTPKTVQKAIKHLKPLKAGEVDPNDPLHKAAGMNDINLRRIKYSKPGGTWKDWPEDLVAACHKKESGKSFSSVYGRMSWNAPSPTMTTLCYGFGNGRFGHPEQDRAISLREAATLQSFPEDYEFVAPGKPVTFKKVGRMIGNAVPVVLGKVIGESIQNHLVTEIGYK